MVVMGAVLTGVEPEPSRDFGVSGLLVLVFGEDTPSLRGESRDFVLRWTVCSAKDLGANGFCDFVRGEDFVCEAFTVEAWEFWTGGYELSRHNFVEIDRCFAEVLAFVYLGGRRVNNNDNDNQVMESEE